MGGTAGHLPVPLTVPPPPQVRKYTPADGGAGGAEVQLA